MDDRVPDGRACQRQVPQPIWVSAMTRTGTRAGRPLAATNCHRRRSSDPGCRLAPHPAHIRRGPASPTSGSMGRQQAPSPARLVRWLPGSGRPGRRARRRCRATVATMHRQGLLDQALRTAADAAVDEADGCQGCRTARSFRGTASRRCLSADNESDPDGAAHLCGTFDTTPTLGASDSTPLSSSTSAAAPDHRRVRTRGRRAASG